MSALNSTTGPIPFRFHFAHPGSALREELPKGQAVNLESLLEIVAIAIVVTIVVVYARKRI